MRHSYIDGPRRIRAPRATPRSRVRFLPAVVALPAVAVLWLTVGLPVLSQVTGAGAGARQARNVVFSMEASGSGTGGSSAAPQSVAAATVSNQVLASYHAEVAQGQARAHAKARAKEKAAQPVLPKPTRRAHAPGTATLATADTTSTAPPQQTSSSPPSKGKSPGTGSSGGSGDSGGTGTTPPSSPVPGGDTGVSNPDGPPDSGNTGDIGRSGGVGGVTPPTPPPPPAPSPPPGSLVPQDIQTTNGGPHNGVAEQNDSITFTFTSTVDPTQILAGWNGSATAVTVRMTPSITQNDGMTILDQSGNQIAALGSVNLHGHYVAAITLFTGSTMTANGNTVTIVLGARSHGVPTENSPTTMVWTTPSGSATESGPADIDF
jgi:hypothetical protein